MSIEVTRVREGNQSWIEPPYDNRWDELTRLRWHAAVAEHDCGVSVRVVVSRNGPRPDYNVLAGRASVAPLSFTEALSFINGVCIGAQQSCPKEGA